MMRFLYEKSARRTPPCSRRFHLAIVIGCTEPAEFALYN